MSDPVAVEESVLRRLAHEAKEHGYELVLPAIFAAVDAGLWEFFLERFQVSNIAVERVSHTTGSVHYTFLASTSSQRIDIGAIRARIVEPSITALSIVYGTLPKMTDANGREYITGLLLLLLDLFAKWMIDDHNQAVEGLQGLIAPPGNKPTAGKPSEPVKTSPEKSVPPAVVIGALGKAVQQVIPRRRGGQTQKDNVWARAEASLGRPRQDIFKEYLERQNIKEADKRAVAAARERFKKALQTGSE